LEGLDIGHRGYAPAYRSRLIWGGTKREARVEERQLEWKEEKRKGKRE